MKFKLLPEFHLEDWEGDKPSENKPIYSGSSHLLSLFINNIVYILAFSIPAFTILFLMAKNHFAPFGNKSMFLYEGITMHLQVLNQINISLRNGSFSLLTLQGLSGEYYSSIVYYIMSPFTLLTLLFDQKYAIGMLSIFTVIRISLGSVFMIYYLTHKLSEKKGSKYDGMLLLFALGYSLSSFALYHTGDFIFYDHFMLFPLFLLGLERLCFQNRPRLFLSISSICLFSQFSLGLSMALFACLYSFVCVDNPFFNRINLFIKTLKYSFFACLLSAITVIPGLYGLKTMIHPCPNNTFTTDFYNFFLLHLFRCNPSYYSVNYSCFDLYCGSVMLMLLCLYICSPKISIKTRLSNLCMLIILSLSLFQHQLMYLFSCFHIYTTTFSPMAFIYISFLILLAYEALPNLRSLPIWRLVSACILPIALSLIAIKLTKEDPNYTSVYISVSIFLLLCIVFILYRIGSIRRKTFQSLLLIVGISEICINAFNAFYNISAEDFYASQAIVKSNQIDTMVMSGKADYYDVYPESTALQQENPLSSFPVSLPISPYNIDLFSGKERIPHSPLEDSLNSIDRLLISTNDNAERLINTDQYKLKLSKTGFDTYENFSAFPVFFTVPGNRSSIDLTNKKNTDFVNKENAVASFLGSQSDIYVPVKLSLDYEIYDTDQIKIEPLGNQAYHIMQNINNDPEDKFLSRRITFRFTPDQSGDLYFYIKGLFHFGNVNAGETYTYQYYVPDVNKETQNIILYLNSFIYDNDALLSLSDRLKQNALIPDHITLSAISFDVSKDNGQDRMLITSLPANSRLSFYIDGKKEKANDLDSHIALYLPSEANTVTLKINLLPLWLGTIVTLLSILVKLCNIPSMIHNSKYLSCLRQNYTNICLQIRCSCKDNYIYILSFFLPLGIYLLAMLLNSCRPFGHNTIFNGDGPLISIPEMIASINLLKEGLPSHSFYGGGGIATIFKNPSVWLLFPYSLFSTDHLLTVLSILTALRISACSFTAVYYMTHRTISSRVNKHDPKLLLTAFTYGLCVFIQTMLNYTNWLDTYMLFPIILLNMDLLMTKGKKKGFIISLSISFILSYYSTMFVCFYLVIRFFTYRFTSFKDFIYKGLRFTFAAVSVGLLSSYTLYAALFSLSGSTYHNKDSQFPLNQWFSSIWYLIRRHEIFYDPVSISFKDGLALLYCGLLSVCLIFTYMLSKKIRISDKLRNLLPLAFLYATINNSVLNYIFNGFHYQHGVPNRFAFLIPMIIAIIGYDAFRLLPKESTYKIIISFVAPLVLLVVANVIPGDDVEIILPFFSTLLLLVIYLSLCILYKKKRLSKKILIICMLTILTIELSASTIYSIHYNIGSEDTPFWGSEDALMLKNSFDVDNSLEHVAYIEPVNNNYYEVHSLRTTALFAGGSITDPQVLMSDYIGQNTEPNEIALYNTTPPMGHALAANRYIMLSDYSTMYGVTDMAMYPIAGSNDTTVFYKNDHIFPFGYFMPASMYDRFQTKSDVCDFWQGFADSFADGKKLIDRVDLSPYDESKPDVINTYESEQNGLDIRYTMHLSKTTDGMMYLYNSRFLFITDQNIADDIDFEYVLSRKSMTDTIEQPYAILFHTDVFEETRKKLSEHSFKVISFDEEHIKGNIDMPEDGFINFSMPYDKCWKATVDGTPAEIVALGGAFLSVKAPAGYHEISLEYVDNRWILPLIFNILCWIIFITVCILTDKHKKQTREI